MRKEFDDFISKMQLLSLCVLSDGAPYSSSAFYAYDKENSKLIIAASKETNHIKAIEICDKVSGTIALDTTIIGKIQGVQFLGQMGLSDKFEQRIYFKRFPFALAMNPTLWTIKVSWAKLTDNRLGFGKKYEWKRDEKIV
ncbi:hypothetical protein [Campylobacter geochelonis]|uniref:hypothetical protein n=1 Tax=Campylobacter geochelonis TaxID=1780362 RepID=UPI0007707D1E|nr:hypothetical protein [Campylobacter geochelonis]CZE49007.1 protein YhbP [Campylobacter geochelonis]